MVANNLVLSFHYVKETFVAFPVANDFLLAFGMVPVEEDPNMAYWRYIRSDKKGLLEVDLSFSAVGQSFQVVMRCQGQDVITVSSERVQNIELRSDRTGSGVHITFDIQGVASEALVLFEPELSCKWWTIATGNR